MRRTDDGDIILSQKEYDWFIDEVNALYAIMDSMPVGFRDMYPNWPSDYPYYERDLTPGELDFKVVDTQS